MAKKRERGTFIAGLAAAILLLGGCNGGGDNIEVDDPEADPQPGIVETPRDEAN